MRLVVLNRGELVAFRFLGRISIKARTISFFLSWVDPLTRPAVKLMNRKRAWRLDISSPALKSVQTSKLLSQSSESHGQFLCASCVANTQNPLLSAMSSQLVFGTHNPLVRGWRPHPFFASWLCLEMAGPGPAGTHAVFHNVWPSLGVACGLTSLTDIPRVGQ